MSDQVPEESAIEEQGYDQYLSFLVADEEYGIPILSVQELRGWTPVTKVPDMPDYIQGVLNLRGTLIPVIDLRLRFGLKPRPYGVTTVIIVVKVKTGEKQRIMGVIVDAVAETYNLGHFDIQPPPMMGGEISAEFVSGLVNQGERMVVLLDLDKLMNSGELAVESSETNDAI